MNTKFNTLNSFCIANQLIVIEWGSKFLDIIVVLAYVS